MKCDELTNDVLLDLAARMTDEQTEKSAEEHMRECRDCGDRYLEVRHINDSTRIALSAQPDPSLDHRITDITGTVMTLKRQHSRKKLFVWIGILVAAAAAVVVWLLTR